ncbi:flagellar motor protein MotD [Dyella soli]|uniref:Flagellar motor protein MotD n=1 Tax=Dyella soli TaxID=522319 RepID=A0A4R0YM20_9GAMM|nr:flagellar motor protein MotD [Dyella soli]TCI06769.1 flagellar motor protein MotD [Dyella soli]
MSRKKKHHEDHVNHEAWAIPYADLMTLLLAFFVVMYAVSVVNEGKYRVMSESIIEAFNGSSHVIAPMPQTRVQPHNVEPAVATPAGQPGAATTPVSVPIPLRPQPVRAADMRAQAQRVSQQNLERIRDQVQRALQPLIDKQMVVVRKTTSWLEIEIRTDILFSSGVAKLSSPADNVLNEIAGILQPFSNPVRIEGYTDDRPINTAVFPSNWELSAARAASVARLFAEHGIDPLRLGIVGWSEYRPRADNTTEDGRNHNRRVLVVVLSDQDAPRRFYNDAEHMGQLAEGDDGLQGPAVAASSAAPAAVARTGAPMPTVVVKPGMELPVNKVMLAGPARPAGRENNESEPATAVPVPGAATGSMTATAPHAAMPGS